ncbi:4Fe-4S dicluster domain-containing protein [Clostridium swellfunianum]|uniref:4Fe-4S dicluster domain-containing protein n=1 Tax=Clostridium swellfunianum TaxID=1367462 RepID=UPI002030DC44|nr:reductive dehalogenase domain-containing protein [Clostridium swellfunianum]MCM0647696.1 4Fe-4S dicluster domain-containing protein [Clostridium swellfunianum]
MKRIDERDTMFARMNYSEGTPQYEDYYRRNPDKKDSDDVIRSKPNLCSEGTMSYDPVNSPIAEAAFMFLSDIKHLSEGEVNPNKVEFSPEAATRRLKGLALQYGAKLVGITKLEDYHFYSHRGRHNENYGEKVTNTHKYGIVFAVEMKKEMLNRAPMVSEIIETSKCYVDAAVIGMVLSYYLRHIGYEARNHMDANYLLIAPLVARDAGLGQIGRNGVLTTKDYGSRVRLGVVTTNLELITDKPFDFGLHDFCELCGNCAVICPGKAIPKDSMKEINGLKRWQITQENCYNLWRNIGTDCGICLAGCPFSQEVETMKTAESYKDNPELIKQAVDEYKSKYKTRPFIKDQPEWLK